MATMDKRKLEQGYYLTVENITFASDGIGAASPNGRTAATAWAADGEVIFHGKLKHILVFALMAFDVASVSIAELFSLTPERDFLNVKNLGDADIVQVVSLDPADGEGIVEADDITFMQHLTNNFRLNWSDSKNVIVQEKADPTSKTLYRGSVLEALAYAYQFHSTGNAPVYTLYNIALADLGRQLNKGVVYPEIAGSNGSVELAKAHISLANFILGVSS